MCAPWRLLTPGLALLALAVPASGQQVADTAYRFANESPAYPPNAGPRVCVDGGHQNYHTVEGRYRPFALLLEQDGYVVVPLEAAFDSVALAGCRIVVIANARAPVDAQGQAYPHAAAFARDEVNALFAWVRQGGSLLLVADHPPFAGAAAGLAALLGFQLFDGYAGPSAAWPTGTMIFGALDEEAIRSATERHSIPHEQFRSTIGEPGRLADHAILRGRTARESVTTVVTFTGHAFFPSQDVEPLLVLGPDASGLVVLGPNAPGARPEEYPRFSLAGWLQGGVRRIASGRVALLGEAAMCSAQWRADSSAFRWG